MECLVRRSEMHVEAILGNVDPGEDGALFVHDPTLQMRARARAAVRVWDCDDGDRTKLCLGLSGPRRTRAMHHSQESLRGLAKRYGVNPKTVAKWKARTSVSDLPTGPREPRSTVLSVEEEAVVSLRSEGIRCCRSTTAFTPCSRPSRI